MQRIEILSPGFARYKTTIDEAIRGFDQLGYKVGKGKRNMVKHIVAGELDLVIKSFRVPNIINRLIYRHFRKSKAHRSYAYACYLLERNIGTPPPVGYIEYRDRLTIGNSYYISVHVQEDHTFRTLIDEPSLPDRETILRQFTRLTYRLHEEHILFMDHSPGNTLIKKKTTGEYGFYLVDLNRMRLGYILNAEERMKNFARLSATADMIGIMSDEYARLAGLDREWAEERMQYYTARHLKRRARRKKLNRRLGKYR